jgi:hypothetical protein
MIGALSPSYFRRVSSHISTANATMATTSASPMLGLGTNAANHCATENLLAAQGTPASSREALPIFERFLYAPLVRAVEWLADLARPIQSGDVNLYLLYVFLVAIVADLIYTY